MQQNNSKNFFFLIAFLEGCCVITLELITAKFLTPVYGNSLYVWSTVIGVTFLSLTLGYFIGGLLSEKSHNIEILLYKILAGVVFYLLLIPLISIKAGNILPEAHILLNIILFSIICLFPPLTALGTVPVLVIKHFTYESNEAGYMSGKIFTISTIGSIITAFLVGLVILPLLGSYFTIFIIAILMAIIIILSTLKKKVYFISAFLLIFIFSLISISKNKNGDKHNGIRTHYFSEGILGQIQVTDRADYSTIPPTNLRMVFVNKLPQTVMDLNSGKPLFAQFVDIITHSVSTYKPGSNVLILGLGGGIMAKEIVQAGYKADVCELDQRIINVAKKYFLTPEIASHINFINDDARHYIKSTNKKYDVVMYDIEKGEAQQHTMYTKECFNDIRQKLNPGGLIILNIVGDVNKSEWKGTRAVLKTAVNSRFQVKYLVLENSLNTFIFISDIPIDSLNFPYEIRNGLAKPTAQSLEDVPILTDDRPVLDILNLKMMGELRTQMLQYYKEYME